MKKKEREKKTRKFLTLLEIKVELTTRQGIMKKPEVRTRGKSNVSSLCTVSSVNTSPNAYGKKAAFKKVKQKCFLCGQTG